MARKPPAIRLVEPLDDAHIGLEARAQDDDHLDTKIWLRLLACSTQIEQQIRQRLRSRFGTTLPRFDYLAQWLWQPIGRVVPVATRSPFAPALLAWRIHGLLDGAGPQGEWVAAHPRLARYLAGADARMRFELASRIARVFDHYLTYRSQWLALWAEGRGTVLGPAAGAVERADEAWQRLEQMNQELALAEGQLEMLKDLLLDEPTL